MLCVNMIAIAGSAYARVVRARAIATVDVNRTELLAQWLEELPTQILQPVVIPALDLHAIMTIEFLYREVL
jgi:hypothetical protein